MRLLIWRRPPIPVLVLHGPLARRSGCLHIDTVGPLVDTAMRAAPRGGTVLLDIDSPGGSAVQSDLIATRIRRRAEERGLRVIAVIAEIGASGGYWLACAADEIVATPMSIVGSVGVVGGGFGFDRAMDRLGVERRLYTAGANKARLDPFSPERPEDAAYVRALMDAVHARFKNWVRSRRGDRLKGDDATLFDGSWMLGERAQALGLIDHLGDLEAAALMVGGRRARMRRFRLRRRGLLPRLLARAAVEEVLEAARTVPSLRI